MHVIQVQNLRQALPEAVNYLLNNGRKEPSRNGSVIVAPEPVTIHYKNPKEHVLLNPLRDANPFFHLMESIWMLAGRQDSVFLDYYIKDFGQRFGNHGIVMDAYGYRWRYGLPHVDQLDTIVNQLRKDPTTRQAVLQMWGAGRDDLSAPSFKPCNLVATFRIIGVKLHMTVFNRSNDLIWGACGSNAVHFALLQEYLAGRIGCEIGEYWQISNNLHIYQNHIDLFNKRLNTDAVDLAYWLEDNSREYEQTQPLVTNPMVIDDDIIATMEYTDKLQKNLLGIHDDYIQNSFLRHTVLPMAKAHYYYKEHIMKMALDTVETVHAPDWRQAGREWLMRRTK